VEPPKKLLWMGGRIITAEPSGGTTEEPTTVEDEPSGDALERLMRSRM